MTTTEKKAKTARDEIARYRKRNPWCAEWYAKDGTIRIRWFPTMRDARAEADRHKDAEVYKEAAQL